MTGEDHADDRSIVGDVKAGVDDALVVRGSSGAGEVRKPGDLVVQANDQAVDRTDGAQCDVVGTIVTLFSDEHDRFVEFVVDYGSGKFLTCSVDKCVIDV